MFAACDLRSACMHGSNLLNPAMLGASAATFCSALQKMQYTILLHEQPAAVGHVLQQKGAGGAVGVGPPRSRRRRANAERPRWAVWDVWEGTSPLFAPVRMTGDRV